MTSASRRLIIFFFIPYSFPLLLFQADLLNILAGCPKKRPTRLGRMLKFFCGGFYKKAAEIRPPQGFSRETLIKESHYLASGAGGIGRERSL
jgi:hypothetical protein